MLSIPKTIHPFPARMAPEIAMKHLEKIPKGSIVLDPMVGSGTTIKIASEIGCPCIGFDVDPLALLIAKVWNTPVNIDEVYLEGYKILDGLRKGRVPLLPWIDTDNETLKFVHYWFDKHQEIDLRRLSYKLKRIDGPVGDVLRVAMSRIIITKNKGASLGRDISHSRPHKVTETNDYDVKKKF